MYSRSPQPTSSKLYWVDFFFLAVLTTIFVCGFPLACVLVFSLAYCMHPSAVIAPFLQVFLTETQSLGPRLGAAFLRLTAPSNVSVHGFLSALDSYYRLVSQHLSFILGLRRAIRRAASGNAGIPVSSSSSDTDDNIADV